MGHWKAARVVHLWRWGLLAALACGIIAFFVFGASDRLSLEALRANRHDLAAFGAARPVRAAILFLFGYIACTALSLPVNVLLALAAGAVFGLAEGAVLVSFAAAIGSTLAFLSSRFLFRAAVQHRFGARLAAVEQGLARDGGAYLLALRLTPVVPYTVVNLVFGLTRFPTAKFYAVSQLGMLPATLVFVNAGTRIEGMTSLSGLVSARLIASLLLLAILPLAGRWLARRLTRS